MPTKPQCHLKPLDIIISWFLHSLLCRLVFFSISILFFFSLTASATSSFHRHVSLCLHAPFDNPHLTCADLIIIFLICSQSSLHQGISTLLSLPYQSIKLLFQAATMLWPCFDILHVSSIHTFSVQTGLCCVLAGFPRLLFAHLLDFLVQNEDNTGRCINNPDGLPLHPD